jgi:hypothetical protein
MVAAIHGGSRRSRAFGFTAVVSFTAPFALILKASAEQQRRRQWPRKIGNRKKVKLIKVTKKEASREETEEQERRGG